MTATEESRLGGARRTRSLASADHDQAQKIYSVAPADLRHESGSRARSSPRRALTSPTLITLSRRSALLSLLNVDALERVWGVRDVDSPGGSACCDPVLWSRVQGCEKRRLSALRSAVGSRTQPPRWHEDNIAAGRKATAARGSLPLPAAVWLHPRSRPRSAIAPVCTSLIKLGPAIHEIPLGLTSGRKRQTKYSGVPALCYRPCNRPVARHPRYLSGCGSAGWSARPVDSRNPGV